MLDVLLSIIHKILLPMPPALPFSPFSDQNVPKRIEGSLEGHRVTQVSGGWRHSMAVDSEGGLWAWGWNKVAV